MRRFYNGESVQTLVNDEVAARRSHAEAFERVIGLDLRADADDTRLALALGRRVLDDIKTLGVWSKAKPDRLNEDSATGYLRRVQEGL